MIQEQEERMTLVVPQNGWADFMMKLVLVYPTLPVFRTLHFVENIGFQVSLFLLQPNTTLKME